MATSLDEILLSDEEDDEELYKTGDTWANNNKAPTVPKMELRDTAVSSALCGTLRWN